ncbi:MAG TPA: hypothetical protein VIF60_17490 [Burkholderiaceae bacterium]|jgi:hypothetical protein
MKTTSKSMPHHLRCKPVLGTLLAFMLAAPLTASAGKYQEPTGEGTASIEFVNDSAQTMSIQIFADPKECTDRGVAFAKAGEQKKLAIAAGRNLAFNAATDSKSVGPLFAFGALGAALGASTLKGCYPVIEFHPEPGHTYIFRMGSDGKDCLYKFYEKPAADSAQAAEENQVPFTPREYVRAWGDSGPWCKKASAEESK